VIEIALRRLRSIDQHLIWIDQAFVNQDGLVERKSQVQLLRDIYSAARITLCYLAEDCKYTPGLLKELTRMTTDDRYADSYELSGLVTSNAYFSRLWIIQEVAVSKNGVLMFGEQLAPWTALYRLHDITKSDFLR
jgi:hypothetical protein